MFCVAAVLFERFMGFKMSFVFLLCLFLLQEVGMPADYVNKLARMFQDIKVSEDLNQVFKEMHKHNKLALPGEATLGASGI